MKDNSMMFWVRLPARLDASQAGELLGFLPHEISVLLSAGLLRPLGKPAQNGHKFFSSKELLELHDDKEWLDKATRAIAKHWKLRNSKFIAVV